MAFKPATCPSCGGNLQVPDDRDKVKCMYCGGNVVIREAIQLATGVNVANLMKLADEASSAANFKEAYDYYTKVLEYDPSNAAAWRGKGEAAGWMSTVADIKTTEMIAGFNNAIKFSQDSEKQAMSAYCADAVNRVTTACYSIARNHVEQFVRLDNEWQLYLTRCFFLISALQVAHAYDPKNRTTIENIIQICADNIRGVSFSDFQGRSKAVYLDDQSEARYRRMIDEYSAYLRQFDPAFVKPEPKRPSAGCFVATATLGDAHHPAVLLLRELRDSHLSQRRAGRLLIGWYYTVGPLAASVIERSRWLRWISYWFVLQPATAIAIRVIRNSQRTQ